MIGAGLLSVLFSGALLVILAVYDPKRLRNHAKITRDRALAPSLPPATRRLLAWLVPAPGAVLGFMSEWWAFFIWLGLVTAVGWVLSQMLAVPGAATFDKAG